MVLATSAENKDKEALVELLAEAGNYYLSRVALGVTCNVLY